MGETLSLPGAAELMAQAQAATGLSDFGPASFRDGLEAFLRSLGGADAANFTREGAAGLTAAFVQRLGHRLAAEDWINRHPGAQAHAPEQPLMITGLPRTGTSAFASILSLEPAFRCLRPWEMSPPAPPPALADEADDPRRLATQARLAHMQETDPGAMTMHLHELDATTEDVPLLNLEFRAQSFTAPAFAYHAWWRDSDMGPTYAYHRRILTMLQSRRPPSRWLLKAPHYVFHLDAVVANYPDARFVVTHRDPIKTLPSWASLLSSLYPPGSMALVPRGEFGERIVAHQAIGMRRLIDFRARVGDDRFLDIHHHAFVDDPIGVLQRVYDFIGLSFGDESQARMQRWAQDNRPGTHGRHVYTTAQFGMDERDIRERFGFYTDAYGVRLETI
jgi:hypothetical protein